MCRRLNRLVVSLLAALVVGLLSWPSWAQEVKRAVPDPPAEGNTHIYALVVIGLLTLGIVAIGFKGTKASR